MLPDSAALAQIKIETSDVIRTSSADFAAVLSGEGAEATLIGQLSWDDDAFGWSTEWRLDVDGQPHRCQLAGVTFDEALRRGLGGAAQILSGNGAAIATACCIATATIRARNGAFVPEFLLQMRRLSS